MRLLGLGAAAAICVMFFAAREVRSSDAPSIIARDVRPGLYALKRSESGALVATGSPIAFQSWGPPGGLPPPLLWQPDESQGDVALLRIRRRLLGRRVYGFGGIAISCAPTWTRLYRASTPIEVVSVLRDLGTFALLGVGSQLGSNVYGPSFYARDPIRIVFRLPRERPAGTNYGVGGDVGPCPALVLADFQVDLALSQRPPPRGVPGPQAPIRIGTSREALVWSRGYPWEIADRATLLAENTWYYGVGLGGYTVRFKAHRVESLTALSEAR